MRRRREKSVHVPGIEPLQNVYVTTPATYVETGFVPIFRRSRAFFLMIFRLADYKLDQGTNQVASYFV
jgi:hypothetical protein